MPLRVVKIYEWTKVEENKPRQKVQTGIGLFHQWGHDYEEFESGPGNYSTAIIEMDDGTVENVHCEMIEFYK